jgi:hypothetical protein
MKDKKKKHKSKKELNAMRKEKGEQEGKATNKGTE